MEKIRKIRRYREKPNPNQISIGACNGNRIHDFLKGFGTLCKDGSILWDTYRPLTKKEKEKRLKEFQKTPIVKGKINPPSFKKDLEELKKIDIRSIFTNDPIKDK